MKILAVIPARAGSKGIPNKNIRLINNKPLVYYAIKNAIDSEFITDVVVTTDSLQIECIAKQMGVNVKQRKMELCGDDVTLDSVVYDVFKDYSCDYVVTMQPTSPTLQVLTLDSAIKYSIEHDLETLISVINKPHLSWQVKDGKKVPRYEKRLNRQYLPDDLVETGAFVITKAEILDKETRFGSNLDVYEISESEALDIDNFSDLRHAEMILKKSKVAIYVNGNNSRGMGHVYRALEVADEFFLKPDIYYDINQTNIEVFGNTTHMLIGIDGIGELLEILQKKQYDLLINDILTTSIDYMIAIRKVLPNAKIVNFEDDGEGIYKADLVINDLYEGDNIPNVKSGEKYFIVSKLFMFYEPITIKENVEKVFISFGGADPQNYSDRLLNIVVNKKYKGIHFIAVLGRAKNNIEELMMYNRYENITVLHDIKNMPEIMSECDIAISSRGRTSYELAVLGIPTMVMSQNEREEKHIFVSSMNGYIYVGMNPSDTIIEVNLNMMISMSKSDRLKFHKMLLCHELKDGRSRVKNLLEGLI